MSATVVLYDGTCPLCQRSVAVLRRLDWLAALEFRDARVPANIPGDLSGIPVGRFMDEMHVREPSGRVTHGFKAFRAIARRVPLLWLVWPLLFVPGVPWVGQKIYLWVAKNRYNLVPCKDGVCQIPAAKG